MPDHFYTTDEQEAFKAARSGYNFEGIPGDVYLTQVPNTHLFHRLYNSSTGNHFYTVDDLEAENAVGNDGYQTENMPCYVYPIGSQPNQPNVIPLYRAYKGSINDHFYTTNWQEFNNAILHDGYSPEGAEGVCCYMYAANNGPQGTASLYRLYPTFRSLGREKIELRIGRTKQAKNLLMKSLHP